MVSEQALIAGSNLKRIMAQVTDDPDPVAASDAIAELPVEDLMILSVILPGLVHEVEAELEERFGGGIE